MTTQLQTTSVTTPDRGGPPQSSTPSGYSPKASAPGGTPSHHILQAELAEMVFEPYDRAATSSIAAPTAASAAGRGSWPTTLRTGSASAGT